MFLQKLVIYFTIFVFTPIITTGSRVKPKKPIVCVNFDSQMCKRNKSDCMYRNVTCDADIDHCMAVFQHPSLLPNRKYDLLYLKCWPKWEVSVISAFVLCFVLQRIKVFLLVFSSKVVQLRGRTVFKLFPRALRKTSIQPNETLLIAVARAVTVMTQILLILSKSKDPHLLLIRVSIELSLVKSKGLIFKVNRFSFFISNR